MDSEKNKHSTNPEKPIVKVTPKGPYTVSGNVSLSKMVIVADNEGYPIEWRELEKYPQQSKYSLCRCGQSENKPYCDNSHKKHNFDGKETAGYSKYTENIKIYDGPDLTLQDNKKLCVGAGFCTRAGNIWNLTTHSDNPEFYDIAIQEAQDCPSGRLVLYDKNRCPLEPEFEKSIAITEDEEGIPGPLWLRGGLQVQSSDKINYEIRNRITLCRCGESENKPYCDGSHLDKETE